MRAPKFAIPLLLTDTQFSPTGEISQFQLWIFAYSSSELPKISALLRDFIFLPDAAEESSPTLLVPASLMPGVCVCVCSMLNKDNFPFPMGKIQPARKIQHINSGTSLGLLRSGHLHDLEGISLWKAALGSRIGGQDRFLGKFPVTTLLSWGRQVPACPVKAVLGRVGGRL